mmetsp:Transcript_30424/g.76410  ORF Transcript_30424/g.76410 Transcript_30424/m.76410 type:complete len:566 (+) Transcript_30424:135-1832(+)|eukprot:CAMPEP_0177650182 /NCGR_PEP_ID=MMETSP0447-20121125/11796_1 /TAXON_ID=0 /ORGANISM="Stygamoeba regulata, Strain BSH-02190019" /LENGTH=565 /DNA_ID=CAMNT_0019153015 /DNA_START=132 /DNA_END=1829 /DNA_ORIENTATION=+
MQDSKVQESILKRSGGSKATKNVDEGDSKKGRTGGKQHVHVHHHVHHAPGSRRHRHRPRGRKHAAEEQLAENLLQALVLGEEDTESQESLAFPNVVKVFVTIQCPDYEQPWQAEAVGQATGSGVVISGQRVLTAAHVVADATFLQVQRTDDPEMVVATVLAVCHECDLAVLSVSKDAFFKDIQPAELAPFPHLRDKVYVAGFPVGGEELSVTEGVVSRIEGQPYSHSQRYLLAVQVDAAINSGNSGGPVFSEDNKLAGIAFQALVEAEATGHIIPPNVIAHFLEGYEQHSAQRDYVHKFPSLGVSVQKLLNPLLRGHLGMDEAKGHSGLRVTQVMYGNSAHGVLEVGDVIMSLDGVNIANNGSVSLEIDGQRLRLDSQIMCSLYQIGKVLKVRILRNKEEREMEVTLKPQVDLVPLAQYDVQPPFFIYMGVVFQPLSLNYILKAFTSHGPPNQFLTLLEDSTPSETRKEVVFIAQTLSDEVNLGYDELNNTIVTHVNDHKIVDLEDLVAAIEGCKDDTLEVRTHGKDVLIFPGPSTELAKQAKDRILQRYHVTSDRTLVKKFNSN